MITNMHLMYRKRIVQVCHLSLCAVWVCSHCYC